MEDDADEGEDGEAGSACTGIRAYQHQFFDAMVTATRAGRAGAAAAAPWLFAKYAEAAAAADALAAETAAAAQLARGGGKGGGGGGGGSGGKPPGAEFNVFAALLAPLEAAMGELSEFWQEEPHNAEQHAAAWCEHASAAAALMTTVHKCKSYRPAEDPTRSQFHRLRSHLDGVLAFWQRVQVDDSSSRRGCVARAAAAAAAAALRIDTRLVQPQLAVVWTVAWAAGCPVVEEAQAAEAEAEEGGLVRNGTTLLVNLVTAFGAARQLDNVVESLVSALIALLQAAGETPAAAAAADAADAGRVVCHPDAAAALAAAVLAAPPGQTALLVTVLAGHLPELPRAASAASAAAAAAAAKQSQTPKKKKARKSEVSSSTEGASSGAAGDCAAAALAALTRVYAGVLRSVHVTAETASPAGRAIRKLLEDSLPCVGAGCLAIDAVPTASTTPSGKSKKRKSTAAEASWAPSDCPFGRLRALGGGHAEGHVMRMDAARTALLAFAMHAYHGAVSLLELCAALSPDLETELAQQRTAEESERSYFECLGPQYANPPLTKVLVEWTSASDRGEEAGVSAAAELAAAGALAVAQRMQQLQARGAQGATRGVAPAADDETGG